MSSTNSADRYAGLATILAVILAVEYSDDYDVWDLAIGAVGLVLAFRYRDGLRGDDSLLSGFTGALAGLRRFLEKFLPLQSMEAGWIKMSYLGNCALRSNRASTASIAFLLNFTPFW